MLRLLCCMMLAQVPQAESAKVTVLLPEEARLWVDDVLCPIRGSRRTFDTPPLDPNRGYFYVLRVSLEKDGQVYQESKRINMRAGQSVSADFSSIGGGKAAITEP